MNPTGYKAKADRKDTGAHYTPKRLANFVAAKMAEQFKAVSSEVSVMDPALGDGELLTSLGNLLSKSQSKTVNLIGYDIDSQAVNVSSRRLKDEVPRAKLDIRIADFLNDFTHGQQNELFSMNPKLPQVDMLIANPPYIRTQVLGSERSRLLAKKFGITGRLDIYQAFVNQISNCLKEGGIAGLILSNRFMYTQSGKATREFILNNFEIVSIWDLGDTKVFEAAVLPVVLILRKRSLRESSQEAEFTSIYSNSNHGATDVHFESIFEALDTQREVLVDGNTFSVKKGKLHFSDGEPWRISETAADDWLQIVADNTYCTFGDVAKIKVGVKTTADKVFIKKADWQNETDAPELLQPLITHHIARRYHSDKPKYSILYPHTTNKLSKKIAVDLDSYPKTKKYLLKHKEQLSSRQYVIDSGRQWFEIWVPHNPMDWSKPKIVFRDISEKPTFWAEFGEAVVNGDCYWIPLPEQDKDLTWLLLAIANSSFIEKFYDHKFTNRLYSGRRRYITQYVSKFPVLNPARESSKAIINLSKTIYEKAVKNVEFTKEEAELDKLVSQAFGVS